MSEACCRAELSLCRQLLVLAELALRVAVENVSVLLLFFMLVGSFSLDFLDFFYQSSNMIVLYFELLFLVIQRVSSDRGMFPIFSHIDDLGVIYNYLRSVFELCLKDSTAHQKECIVIC